MPVCDVYRVENSYDGSGPYWGIGSIIGIIGKADSQHQRPLPEQDGLSRADAAKYHYGFASLEQLHLWWGNESKREMAYKGYIISHYACPRKHILFGGCQLVFLREKARYLRTICPLSLSIGNTVSIPSPSWAIDAPHTGVY